MSRDALIDWLYGYRPDLAREVDFAADNDDRRVILNAITGLNVRCTDLIEEGCSQFLAALIRISKETPPGAVDNRKILEPVGALH